MIPPISAMSARNGKMAWLGTFNVLPLKVGIVLTAPAPTTTRTTDTICSSRSHDWAVTLKQQLATAPKKLQLEQEFQQKSSWYIQVYPVQDQI